jgi:hypothetical protein
MKLNCPSCGAPVEFSSSISVFAVCSYCGSSLVRHDMNLEDLGKMAQLAEDTSPIQIGTIGKYKNLTFHVVGRVKVGWEQGEWNEWYVAFEDGRFGWLADAQGDFGVCFALNPVPAVPTADAIGVGSKVSLAEGQSFSVSDIKTAIYRGSEGELPFRAMPGRTSKSVDLNNEQGGFATIDYSEQEGVAVYVGEWLDTESFKIKKNINLNDW